MRSGPIVIGYDGSPAVEHAMREAGPLLAVYPALVVVVWKQGLGFEMLELPTVTGLPPAPIDIRAAADVDEAMAERAQQLAQKGAEIARTAGFEADGLAVADPVDVSVAETLVDVARKHDARAILVGARGLGALQAVVLGSVSHDVVRHSERPVVVVRDSDGKRQERK